MNFTTFCTRSRRRLQEQMKKHFLENDSKTEYWHVSVFTNRISLKGAHTLERKFSVNCFSLTQTNKSENKVQQRIKSMGELLNHLMYIIPIGASENP